MPINTPHPEYTASLAVWKRVKDCLDGPDAVKRGATIYIPRLKGQKDDEYDAYVSRALYFNATGRTHEAMLGFIFRKAPTTAKADILKKFLLDVDLANSPMTSYARQTVYSVAGTGRAGTLVDWSTEEGRPYFAFYPESCILNWEETRIGGKTLLTMLVLKEVTLEATDADPYERSAVTRYREIILGEDGVTVQIWKEKSTAVGVSASVSAPGSGAAGAVSGTAEKEGEPVQLMRRNQALTFIPFVFHGSETTGCCIDKAPLGDISAVNVSHYQSSADLENGRHICGIPTPWAAAFSSEEKLYLGTKYAWTTDNPGASCGWLEFTGTGLGALEKALEEKQGQMASLGARLIEPRAGNDAEAYDTVQLRASAETSTLARITMLTSEGLSQALQIAAWWIGTEAELDKAITYQLNTDFASSGIRPEMLTALTSAYQQSIISRETLFFQLKRGELYQEGRTLEEEKAAIESDPPMPFMPPGGFGGGPGAGGPGAGGGAGGGGSA